MKIYTGGGDKGKTSLFSGERVDKSDLRIEAYGDLDELNSILGALAVKLPESRPKIREEILNIQSDILHIGAWLATTPGSSSTDLLEKVASEQIDNLEAAIDRLEGRLPILKGFILPGGDVSAAWAHVARTVCRRVERRVIALMKETDDGSDSLGDIIIYLNRLSDYLFVVARYCNQIAGVDDIVWTK